MRNLIQQDREEKRKTFEKLPNQQLHEKYRHLATTYEGNRLTLNIYSSLTYLFLFSTLMILIFNVYMKTKLLLLQHISSDLMTTAEKSLIVFLVILGVGILIKSMIFLKKLKNVFNELILIEDVIMQKQKNIRKEHLSIW